MSSAIRGFRNRLLGKTRKNTKKNTQGNRNRNGNKTKKNSPAVTTFRTYFNKIEKTASEHL